MIAALRPTDWNWLLFGHLATAFLLVGGLILMTVVSIAAERTASSDQVPLLRALAFRVNLLLVVPMLVAIHIFGAILSDREYDSSEPGWLGAGFAITSVATIVAVVLVFLQFWVVRRVRRGATAGWPAVAATYLAPLLLAAMVVVIVLMAGKPAG
jgi:hypothetical protein